MTSQYDSLLLTIQKDLDQGCTYIICNLKKKIQKNNLNKASANLSKNNTIIRETLQERTDTKPHREVFYFLCFQEIEKNYFNILGFHYFCLKHQ